MASRAAPSAKPAFAVVVGSLLVASNAHAYLDPGTSGLLYQIFLPVAVFVLSAWRWIKESARKLVDWLTSKRS